MERFRGDVSEVESVGTTTAVAPPLLSRNRSLKITQGGELSCFTV